MPNSSFDEIIEDFEFLDDWEDRYRYIIELGKKMSPLESAMKVASTKVDGCASQVWLHPTFKTKNNELTMSFIGDSDSMIVKGLIGVLNALLDGISLSEINRIDIEGQFTKLQLQNHLSSQRSNGLKSMIVRIKTLAKNESEGS